MASSGSHRSGLLTAGGVLSIIVGAITVIRGGVVVGLIIAAIAWARRWVMPLPPSSYWEIYKIMIPAFIWAASFFAVGIVAVVGGVSAVRRKTFGLSLAGAICAPSLMILGWCIAGSTWARMFFFEPLAMAVSNQGSVILGILAVIFVVLGRREFEALRG
jgi:hypothetical protein